MKKIYLDLSTGHLSRDTRNFLDNRHGTNNWPAFGWPAITLGISTADTGYFITVPNLVDDEVSQQMVNVPRDLRACLAYAASQGAELIRFDADGYVDGNLPGYQEI